MSYTLYLVSYLSGYAIVRYKINIFPALAIGYVTYSEIEKAHHNMMKKNPADYENEK